MLSEVYIENMGIGGDMILKLHTLVYSIHSGVWGFVSNRKLIITLGKKQKRKNESSDELSDAKQTPQRPLKDEDSQVSSQYSSFRICVCYFYRSFFPSLQKVILPLTQ